MINTAAAAAAGRSVRGGSGGGGGANGRARPAVQSATRWAVPTAGARDQPSARPSTLGPRCMCVAAHHTHSFIVRRFFRSHPSTGRPPRTTFRSRVSSYIIIIRFVVVVVRCRSYCTVVASSSCVYRDSRYTIIILLSFFKNFFICYTSSVYYIHYFYSTLYRRKYAF